MANRKSGFRFDMEKVELLALDCGMSTHQLAIAAGLSSSTICQTNRRSSAAPATIAKVAAVLGVKPSEIVQRVEDDETEEA